MYGIEYAFILTSSMILNAFESETALRAGIHGSDEGSRAW